LICNKFITLQKLILIMRVTMSKRFQVKYSREGSTSVLITSVTASSASQAKEQIKARYNGKVKIISAVEQ
jgi:hypothetical protein